jgi:hypothetical protein
MRAVCAAVDAAVRGRVLPRRAVALLGIAMAAVAVVDCKGVLGLDAPELEPCGDACADAGLDAADARPRDATSEQGPVRGVRCGGGAFPLTGCVAPSPVCCQVTADVGATSYECRASAASCEEYAIACASGSDCPGDEVCCRHDGAIRCDAVSACADADLVCDPAGPKDQCPSGWTCSANVMIAGQPSPYAGCAP